MPGMMQRTRHRQPRQVGMMRSRYWLVTWADQLAEFGLREGARALALQCSPIGAESVRGERLGLAPHFRLKLPASTSQQRRGTWNPQDPTLLSEQSSGRKPPEPKNPQDPTLLSKKSSGVVRPV